MDLRYANLVSDLSSTDEAKQVFQQKFGGKKKKKTPIQITALLDVIHQINLGRDVVHWLPAILSRSTVATAGDAVKKLAYAIASACTGMLSSGEEDQLYKAVLADLKRPARVDVMQYGLRYMMSQKEPRLRSFFTSPESDSCFKHKDCKVRVEILRVLVAFMKTARHSEGGSREIRAVQSIYFTSNFYRTILELILDPLDAVSEVAFQALHQLICSPNSEEEINAHVINTVAPDFFRISRRMGNMSVKTRRSSLSSLTVLCIEIHKRANNLERTPVAFAETELQKCLSYAHVPSMVITSGECILKIAQFCSKPCMEGHTTAFEQLLLQPYYRSFGFPVHLLWETAQAFIALLSFGGMDPETTKCLVSSVTDLLPRLPPHLQWGCVKRYLDLPLSYQGKQHSAVRLTVFVAGFDKVMKLTLAHVANALSEGVPLSVALYLELSSLKAHPMWSTNNVKEQAVYTITTTVMQILNSIPSTNLEMNTAWIAIGMVVTGMVIRCFTWGQDKAGHVAPLHNALKCMLKVVERFENMKQTATTEQHAQWVETITDIHIATQHEFSSILLNGEIGKACRTVTKVGLLCTAAALMPTVAELPESMVEMGLYLQSGIIKRLSQGCAQYMVDERETLSLALFHALMSFGAIRGEKIWEETDSAIENVMRDRTKSATAPHVLMSVKHKLDKIREKVRNGAKCLTLKELTECGVPGFSEHHPALHHDLSPADIHLHLKTHEILMHIRAFGLKFFKHSNITELLPRSPVVHPTYSTVITSPDDPVQILSTYSWQGSRVDVCLSISNATHITLKNVRATIGCTGHMVPMFKPITTQLSSQSQEGGVKATNRSDVVTRVFKKKDNNNNNENKITQLPPGGSTEIVRIFMIASHTVGMGFSTMVDLEIPEDGDGEGEENDAFGMIQDAATGNVVRLQHLMVEKHPLLAYPAANANQLLPYLPVSSRFYTIHVDGDVAAIKQRIDWEMCDTPFVDITPQYTTAVDAGPDENISCVFFCGLRGEEPNDGSEVLSLTVSSMSVGGQCVKGSTCGYQCTPASIPSLQKNCVVLSWLIQASSQLSSDLVTCHPSFNSFFARISDTTELHPYVAEDALRDPPVLPSSEDAMSEWKALKARHNNVMQATRVPPVANTPEFDPWAAIRTGTTNLEDEKKDILTGSVPAPANDMFGAQSSIPAGDPDLFGARSQNLFSTAPPAAEPNLFGEPADTGAFPPPSENLFSSAPPQGNNLFNSAAGDAASSASSGEPASKPHDVPSFPPPSEDLFSAPQDNGVNLFGAPAEAPRNDSSSSGDEPAFPAGNLFPPQKSSDLFGGQPEVVPGENLFGAPAGDIAFPPPSDDLFPSATLQTDGNDLFGVPAAAPRDDASSHSSGEPEKVPAFPEPAEGLFPAPQEQEQEQGQGGDSNLFGVPAAAPRDDASSDSSSEAEKKPEFPEPAQDLFSAPQEGQGDSSLFGVPTAAPRDDASSHSSSEAEKKPEFPEPAQDLFSAPQEQGQGQGGDSNLFGENVKPEDDDASSFPPPAENLFTQSEGVPGEGSLFPEPTPDANLFGTGDLFGAASLPAEGADVSGGSPAIAAEENLFGEPPSFPAEDKAGESAVPENLFPAVALQSEPAEEGVLFPSATSNENLFGAPPEEVPVFPAPVEEQQEEPASPLENTFDAPAVSDAVQQEAGPVFPSASPIPVEDIQQPQELDANTDAGPSLEAQAVPAEQDSSNENLFGAPAQHDDSASPAPLSEQAESAVPKKTDTTEEADEADEKLAQEESPTMELPAEEAELASDVNDSAFQSNPRREPEAAPEEGGGNETLFEAPAPFVIDGASTLEEVPQTEDGENLHGADGDGVHALVETSAEATEDKPYQAESVGTAPVNEDGIPPETDLFGAQAQAVASGNENLFSSSAPADDLFTAQMPAPSGSPEGSDLFGAAPVFPASDSASPTSSGNAPVAAGDDLFGAPSYLSAQAPAANDLFSAPPAAPATSTDNLDDLFGAPAATAAEVPTTTTTTYDDELFPFPPATLPSQEEGNTAHAEEEEEEGEFPMFPTVVTRVGVRWSTREASKDKTLLGFSRFSQVVGWGKGKGKADFSTDPAKCGEDSFFICEDMMSSVGVADGVGGWRSAGVDPGEIARGVMTNCAEISKQKYITPQWLLAEGYWKVKYGKEVAAGSTTACLASLREVRHDEDDTTKQMILTTNVGDSGFILLREGKIIKSSDPQRQGYNAPMQLAVVPKSMSDQNYIQTEPYEATNTAFEVLPGDILVLATDGVWDNVDFDQIEPIARDIPDLSQFAHQIVVASSTRPRKPDDVTVVAARV